MISKKERGTQRKGERRELEKDLHTLPSEH